MLNLRGRLPYICGYWFVLSGEIDYYYGAGGVGDLLMKADGRLVNWGSKGSVVAVADAG